MSHQRLWLVPILLVVVGLFPGTLVWIILLRIS